MQDKIPVSVIMATFLGVKSEWLDASIESLVNQTSPPAEIILVLDGEVSNEQLKVIRIAIAKHQSIHFKIINQYPRKGLASALNLAIKNADYDILARMDSDDISDINRFKIQFNYLKSNPDIGVVCSWHDEFEVEGDIKSVKKTPVDYPQIVESLNYRNVVSHPTLMLRKSSIVSVGCYDTTVGLLEDYDLHLRLISMGVIYHCIPIPLVHVRISPLQRVRRGGLVYLINEMRFRNKAFLLGRLSFMGWIIGLIVYPLFRIVPSSLKKIMYQIVRSKNE